ncbi:MAG: hypothetical protein KGJ93_01530 [Patescibacteria group bacterium]|nr:hypothetical protein [Patescibacteria group bacterium]
MRIKQKRKVVYRKWTYQGGIPAVILQGRFLEQFGFRLGSYFLVDYRPGSITLTTIKPEINNLLEERK